MKMNPQPDKITVKNRWAGESARLKSTVKAEGYVVMAGPRLATAIKFSDGHVARFPNGGGDAMMCGDKVAMTFFEEAWNNNPKSEKQILQENAYRRDHVEQTLALQAEWDRMLKKRYNDTYECMVCGALVANQVKHFNFHTQTDIKMQETLEALFT